MPEINQYSFKWKEVAAALIKEANLHEGKWQVAVQFGMAVANMGPTPQELVPGAGLAIQSVVLIKAIPESPDALVADAAEVNPASTG